MRKGSPFSIEALVLMALLLCFEGALAQSCQEPVSVYRRLPSKTVVVLKEVPGDVLTGELHFGLSNVVASEMGTSAGVLFIWKNTEKANLIEVRIAAGSTFAMDYNSNLRIGEGDILKAYWSGSAPLRLTLTGILRLTDSECERQPVP